MKAFWAGLLLGGAAAGLFVYASMRSDPVARLEEAMRSMPPHPMSDSDIRLSMHDFNTSMGFPILRRVYQREELPDDNTFGTIYSVKPAMQLTQDMFSATCVYYAANPIGFPILHFALVLKDPAPFVAGLKKTGSTSGSENDLILTSIAGLEIMQLDRLDPSRYGDGAQDAVVLRLSYQDVLAMAETLRGINPDGVVPLCNDRVTDDDKAFLELRYTLGGELPTKEELGETEDPGQN